MLNDRFAAVWSVAMFPMVFLWLGLCWWVFRRPKTQHSATFRALGSPSLFWNNSLRTGWSFMRFLYRSEWKDLDDPILSRVCQFMSVLFVLYVLLFMSPLAFALISGPSGPANS
jgi:hypothetical protein